MLDHVCVGKQIVSLRKKSGLTQEELAAKLGITAQAISKWENGHTLPETAMLPLLAEHLACTIDAILLPFSVQDRAFGTFTDALSDEARALATQLYREMKRRFDFTLEIKEKFYVFDDVTDGVSAVFVNPHKDDFIIRMDAAPMPADKSTVFVRLSLTNCGQYMHVVARMPAYIQRAFRCEDCNSCTCACPYLMAYTFEGKAYRQCHFITISLQSEENLAHIVSLVTEEQARQRG